MCPQTVYVGFQSSRSKQCRDNPHEGLNTNDSPPLGFRNDEASWMSGEMSSQNLKSLSFQAPFTVFPKYKIISRKTSGKIHSE